MQININIRDYRLKNACLINGLILLSLILLFQPLLETATAKPLGGTAGAFLRLGLGADRIGMGDCGVAIPGDGLNSYYNPAGLTGIEGRQALLGYRWMSLDRSMMYAIYSTHLDPNAGLAFGIIRAGTSNISGRYSNGEEFDVLSQSDNIILGSFALQPTEMVSIGIAIKWYINTVPDILDDDKNLNAYGMGVDLGVMIKASNRITLGLQARDLDAKYTWETSEVWGDDKGGIENEFPILLRIGAAYQATPNVLAALDVVVYPGEAGDSDDGIQPRYGLEYNYPIGAGQSFILRTGWNSDAPTFGIGLEMDTRIGPTRMDYAYVLDPTSPGDSHLVGWKFMF